MGSPAHKQHPRYFPRVSKQRLLQSWFKVSRQQLQLTTTTKKKMAPISTRCQFCMHKRCKVSQRLLKRFQEATKTRQCLAELQSLYGDHERSLHEDGKMKSKSIKTRTLDMPRSQDTCQGKLYGMEQAGYMCCRYLSSQNQPQDDSIMRSAAYHGVTGFSFCPTGFQFSSNTVVLNLWVITPLGVQMIFSQRLPKIIRRHRCLH